MFWSFTWLITPAILLGTVAVCGFVVTKIVKKAKSKRQNKLQQAQQDAEAQTEEQQLEGDATPIRPATLEAEAEHAPNPQPQTDAQFLKSLTNNFRFDAKNFDIISSPEGKKLYLAWLNQKAIFSFMKENGKNIDGTPLTEKDIAKTIANIAKLDATAEKQFGHKIFPAPDADYALTITDEDGVKITDDRNIIFCGKEDSNFKDYFSTNNEDLQTGSTEPTILQLDLENQKPIIVSSTFMGAFYEGCKDAIMEYADYVKSGNTKCTAHFISGENDARTIDTQVCESKEDVKAFLNASFDKIIALEEEPIAHIEEEPVLAHETNGHDTQSTLDGWLTAQQEDTRQTKPTYDEGMEK